MKINKAIAAMDKSGSFRIYMAVTSQMVQDAHDTHHTSPIATHALGRALTGTAIMGLMMRERERLYCKSAHRYPCKS